MAATQDSKSECAFMKMPLEIRLMIYRPLLVSKYTMKEQDMNSKEYDNKRQKILDGPDQTYEFDTAILRTNRKINEEAKDLCRRENNFVCLTSRRFSFFRIILQSPGFQLIAKGPKAHCFWNVCMTLTLDFPKSFDAPRSSSWDNDRCELIYAPEDGNPWKYIFCSSQLLELCRLLLKNNVVVLRHMELSVEIDSIAQTGQATETGSTPDGLSRVDELLNPLRQLHSFGAVHIHGPLSDRYRDELSASICKDCPTPEAFIHLNMLSLDRADEQLSKGHFRKANILYKAALSSIRSCKRPLTRNPTFIADGPFSGLTPFGAISNIVVRLQGRIASVYFQTGQLRMARIYTERALDPRRPYKETHIETEDWEGVVYAEVLRVAARISYANHNIDEALDALHQAHVCVPLDEEIDRQYEVWNNQSMELQPKREERRRKRKEAKEIHSRKEDEKIEGLFMVACNQKARGDRLLQSGRSNLAVFTYEKALHKVGTLRKYWLEEVKVKTRKSSRLASRNNLSFPITSGPFKDLSAGHATKVLRFKVQASMAAAFSHCGRYTDVIDVAEAALYCDNRDRNCFINSIYDCYHSQDCYFGSEERDWAERLKSDYAKIFYHKALALEKMGDTSKAIEDMEQALKYDPENEMALAELSRWQREMEEKVAHDSRMQENKYIRRVEMGDKRELKARELRQEKMKTINIMQDRLREKQIRRREKS